MKPDTSPTFRLSRKIWFATFCGSSNFSPTAIVRPARNCASGFGRPTMSICFATISYSFAGGDLPDSSVTISLPSSPGSRWHKYVFPWTGSATGGDSAGVCFFGGCGRTPGHYLAHGLLRGDGILHADCRGSIGIDRHRGYDSLLIGAEYRLILTDQFVRLRMLSVIRISSDIVCSVWSPMQPGRRPKWTDCGCNQRRLAGRTWLALL